MNQPVTCPVCHAQSMLKMELSADLLRQSTAQFIGAKPTDQVNWQPYDLYECSACRLQFSNPMRPADSDLYEWLDRDGSYYLSERWEWDKVEAIIRKEANVRPITVLEFGAGDGRFLKRLLEAGVQRAVAIERSDIVAKGLRSQGLEAFSIDKADSQLRGVSFDFVLSFHCVEHVSDPVDFLKNKRSFAGEMGKIMFSVPYSPMHFETRMFDPLNHPPHHMTRWNKQSLHGLARQLGEQLRLDSPPALPTLKRVRHALYCEHYGPNWNNRTRLARYAALLNPIEFYKEYSAQATRDLINGQPAGDVVLIELTRG